MNDKMKKQIEVIEASITDVVSLVIDQDAVDRLWKKFPIDAAERNLENPAEYAELKKEIKILATASKEIADNGMDLRRPFNRKSREIKLIADGGVEQIDCLLAPRREQKAAFDNAKILEAREREAAEAERIAKIEGKIEMLRNIESQISYFSTSQDVEKLISTVKNFDFEALDEFKEKGKSIYNEKINRLQDIFDNLVTWELDAADAAERDKSQRAEIERLKLLVNDDAHDEPLMSSNPLAEGIASDLQEFINEFDPQNSRKYTLAEFLAECIIEGKISNIGVRNEIYQ